MSELKETPTMETLAAIGEWGQTEEGQVAYEAYLGMYEKLIEEQKSANNTTKQ